MNLLDQALARARSGLPALMRWLREVEAATDRARVNDIFRAVVRVTPAFAGPRCAAPSRRVAVLLGVSVSEPLSFQGGALRVLGGHIEIPHLLDDADWDIVFVTAPPAQPAQAIDWTAYDLVINAIADQDRFDGELAAAAAMLEGVATPIVNRPERIRLTGRDAVAALMAGCPRLTVPTTIRVERATLGSPDFAPSRHGLRYPLILRPAGSQSGKGLVRVDGAIAQAADGDGPVYVTNFHETARDGIYGKRRVWCVSDRVIPSHIFYDTQWNVHLAGGRNLMMQHAWMREEEERFIAADLAGSPIAEVAAWARRGLGLDLFGIDYTELPNGDILLFEINACMRSAFPELAEERPATARATRAVAAAVKSMLAEKAAHRDGPGGESARDGAKPGS